MFRQKPDGASRGVPAEGVDANPRTARGCGVGGNFPPIKKLKSCQIYDFAVALLESPPNKAQAIGY